MFSFLSFLEFLGILKVNIVMKKNFFFFFGGGGGGGGVGGGGAKAPYYDTKPAPVGQKHLTMTRSLPLG